MNTVYYSPSYKGVITAAHPHNTELSAYGSKISDLLLEHPDMVLISLEEASRLQDDAYRTKPTLTTEEKFNYALECLPPQNWQPINGGDYFQMMEYYACKNNTYYTWMDNAWLKPAQVEALLNEVEAAQ